MIFVDDRKGSKQLADLVTDGILTHLEFGDAFFTGNGLDGDVDIGVERKTIGDLVNSVSTGRLGGHQIPGLLETYFRVYLIVEGVWKGNSRTGELEVRKGKGWHNLDRGGRRFSYLGLWAYLNTLEVMTGVMIRPTVNISGTASMIEGLYKWWQKPWNKHESHLQMHKSGPPTALMKIGKPSLLRCMAAELPGIGWGRSLAVEKQFPSVEAMVLASEWEWRHVEGIGKITAKNVWEAMR